MFRSEWSGDMRTDGTPTYEKRIGIYIDEKRVNGRIFRSVFWLDQFVRDQKCGEETKTKVISLN